MTNEGTKIDPLNEGTKVDPVNEETVIDWAKKKDKIEYQSGKIIYRLTILKILLWCFAIGLLFFAYRKMSSKERGNTYIINEINLPENLSKSGLSSTIVDHEIKKYIDEIHAKSQKNIINIPNISNDYSDAENAKIFDLEYSGISLRKVKQTVDFFLFPKPSEINCSFIKDSNKIEAKLEIGEEIRNVSKYFEEFPTEAIAIDNLLKEISFEILKITRPVVISRHYINVGSYSQALELAFKSLKLEKNEKEDFKDTSNILPNYFIFLCNLQLGKVDSALSFALRFEAELRKIPSNNLIRVVHSYLQNNIGAIYTIKGKEDLAKSYFKDSNKTDENPYANYNLADYYISSTHFKSDSAIYYLKRTKYNISAYNDLSENLKDTIDYFLAYLYIIKKDVKNAKLSFVSTRYRKGLLEDYPLKANSPLFLYDTNDVTIKELESVINLYPEYSPALYFRGQYFFKHRKYDSAIVYFNKAIKYENDFLEPYIQNAKIYMCKKQYKLLDSNINAVLKINPNHIAASNIKCEIFIKNKDFYNAQLVIKKLLEKYPFDIEVNKIRVQTLKMQSRYQECDALVSELNTTFPNNPYIQSSLADAFKRNGKYNQAIALYQAALLNNLDTTNLENKKIFRNLTICYWAVSDIKNTYYFGKKALCIDPDDIEIMNTLDKIPAKEEKNDKEDIRLRTGNKSKFQKPILALKRIYDKKYITYNSKPLPKVK